ncbi:MAG TPA: YsnF/AvaK domain-containing protein [Acetobacteraceae bacterium]
MAADTKDVPNDVLANDVLATGAVRGESLQSGTAQRSILTDAADTEVIPVLREELKVSKREVETGRVVIHKTVSERDENVEMLLRRTDVSVERVPVGRTVTEAPASREEGDVLIIPILEEVLVVEKRLVLKEELHIRKTTTERTAHEVVRLRTETAKIEPSGNVSVTGDASKES